MDIDKSTVRKLLDNAINANYEYNGNRYYLHKIYIYPIEKSKQIRYEYAKARWSWELYLRFSTSNLPKSVYNRLIGDRIELRGDWCYYKGALGSFDDLMIAIEYFNTILNSYVIEQQESLEYTPAAKQLDNHTTLSECNENVELVEKSVRELFTTNLSIPDYQRIYCWEDENVVGLWQELINVEKSYHLGSIILHEVIESNGTIRYDIIDGQQRLVTITLMLLALRCKDPLPLLYHKFDSLDAKRHIANTKSVIAHLKDNSSGLEINTILEKVQLSVLILRNNSNLDLAFTFFSNQNSKGVKLSDFDLLKAHHLRYIYNDNQAEHLAKNWNIISTEFENPHDDNKRLYIETSLAEHIYRLRRWMRYRDIEDYKARYVRDEYVAAPIMDGIPPFGERFYFDEKIQGGVHFFAYVENFVYKYKEFCTCNQVQRLRKSLVYESHGRYGSVIETLLFGYFIKFGTQYLSEALFCIVGVIAQHRYSNGRARLDKIYEHAKQMQVIMGISQASSSTFFFAEMLPRIKLKRRDIEPRGIKYRFYERLCELFREIDDVRDKQILRMIQDEYK